VLAVLALTSASTDYFAVQLDHPVVAWVPRRSSVAGSPSAPRCACSSEWRGGWIAVFGLGAAYGLAGFCSGPILGAVLTIAALDGQPARGGALLAVYALGMAAPMFVLAALWQRYELGRRRWLRGRVFTLGPLRLHTTTTISGLLFIGIGVLFLVFDGTAALSGVLGLTATTDTQLDVQNTIIQLSARVPDTALLIALAALIVLTTAWRLRRRTHAHHATPASTEPPRCPNTGPANTHDHEPQQARGR